MPLVRRSKDGAPQELGVSCRARFPLLKVSRRTPPTTWELWGGWRGEHCFSFFSSSLPLGSSLTAGKGIRMRSSGPNHSLDSEKQNRADTC